MAFSEKIQAILDKINQKLPLTKEEDMLYLVEVVGFDKEKAENVIAIKEESSDTVMVD